MVVALQNLPDVASVLTRCCAASNIRGGGAKEKEIAQEFEERVTLAHWAADDPDREDPDAEEIPDIILEVLRRENWAPVLSDANLQARRLER